MPGIAARQPLQVTHIFLVHGDDVVKILIISPLYLPGLTPGKRYAMRLQSRFRPRVGVTAQFISTAGLGRHYNIIFPASLTH